MRYRNPCPWTFAKPMSFPRPIVTIMNPYSSATKNGFTAWLRGHLPRLARVSASISRIFHASTSCVSRRRWWDMGLLASVLTGIQSKADWEGLPHMVTSLPVLQGDAAKVNEQTLDVQTGKRSSKGNSVKFNRGDLVLTDCNVTCSNYGTTTKPKFPLLELWTTVLLPELEALAKPGGPCEGAIVVLESSVVRPLQQRPSLTTDGGHVIGE